MSLKNRKPMKPLPSSPLPPVSIPAIITTVASVAVLAAATFLIASKSHNHNHHNKQESLTPSTNATAPIVSFVDVNELEVVKGINARQAKCLTDNLYHEARGEGEKGMELVAKVTLNRVKSSKYPDNICSVVYQKSQFSWTRGRKTSPVLERTTYKKAENIAIRTIRSWNENGRPFLLEGAVHFHTKFIKPSWSYYRTEVARHGNHIFLK